ncbi:SpoVR family protein [Bacillus licheniformis]|nr:SpoVR family protein [Bacillus licheniformis]
MKRWGRAELWERKIFEVREIESDISFIRNYLTKDLVMREDLYLFQNREGIINRRQGLGGCARSACQHESQRRISLFDS